MGLRSVLGDLPGVRPLWRRIYGAHRRRVEARNAPPPGFDDRPDRETARDLRRLTWTNRLSRRPITDPSSPVVVSMTTYGARIATVHLPIESVARGTLRPFRHILYLDDPALMAKLPRPLRRLRRRGLEIELVPAGMKVHTKHYFYVHSTERHTMPLATNEDDILFPPFWLASMVDGLARHPDDLVTPRAHRIVLDGDAVAPYTHWVPCTTDRPSRLHFGTTVSGQIYPPAFLDYVRDAGDAFLELCPDNDDLWLHHLAVQSGRRIVQTTDRPQHYPFVPGTQATGLYFTNIVGGNNDRQIARTYTAEDLRRLREDDAVSDPAGRP